MTFKEEELEEQIRVLQRLLKESQQSYNNLYKQLQSLQNDKKYPTHYLTVGKLKEKLKSLPDDGGVYIQRVEDRYFEDGGWICKELPCPEWPGKMDEYMEVWCTLNYDDKNLYLTPHY